MSGWSQTEIKDEIETEIEEEFCAVVESIKSEEERNADIKPPTADLYQLQRVETRSEYSESTVQSNDDVGLPLRCTEGSKISESSMSGGSQTEIKAEIETEIEEEFCAVLESIKSEEERNVNIKPATADLYHLQRVETRLEYPESTVQSNDDVGLPLRCRLCAIPNNEMVEIFSSLEMKDILEKIEYALPITVKETDALPKQICRLCLGELDRCYRFRKTVAEAEKRLLVFEKLASMKSEKTERNYDSSPLHNTVQGSTESDNVDGPSETNSDVEMNNAKLTITHKDAPKLRSCSVVLSILEIRSEKKSDVKNDGKSSSNTEDRNTDGRVVSENHQASTCDPEANMENSDDLAPAHFTKRLYKCDICAKAFQRKGRLIHHIQVHTKKGLRPHKCEVCAKTFNHKSHMTEHSRTHTDKRLWPYKCEVCAKMFNHKSHMTEHSRTHTDKRLWPYKCEVCAKMFNHKSHMTRHGLIHTNERLWPHKCEVCAKTFKGKSELTRHGLIHTNERLWPHKCEVCAKTFKQKCELTRHGLIHTNERLWPHKCEVCAKTFKQKCELTQHSQNHRNKGLWPHKCEVCAKMFKGKSELTRHGLIHTNERLWPHKCEACAKKFKQKWELTRHGLTHKNEKLWPHKCNICAKMFKEKCQLTRHSESH